MTKKQTTDNYKRGGILLKELQKSGQMLMSGSFCYAYFIYQQIELNLQTVVEQVEENSFDFTTIEVDLSGQNFTKYYFDLSVFSSFTAYDRCEAEQWLAAGYLLDELDYLRTAHLFGERWSDEDKGGSGYDRGFTISLIVSLSTQLGEKLVQFSKEDNVPLPIVISIFRGLWNKDHQMIELMVDATDSDNLELGTINGVAHKIHDTFLEYLSMVDLSVAIELVWVAAVIDDDRKSKKNKENIIQNVLRRHCFHVCCEEQIFQLSGVSLVQYLQDRYLYVKESFYWLCELLAGRAKAGGKDIQLKLAKRDGDFFREVDFSLEEYELGADIANKIYEKMFVHKYRLKGYPNNLIGYLSKIIFSLKRDCIANLYKNTNWGSYRTRQRYLKEYPEEFTPEVLADSELLQQVIKNIALRKEKNSRHVKDYHLTQNKLIEVFLDATSDDPNEETIWASHFEANNIKLKKLGRRAYINRLQRLEKEGVITPVRIKGKKAKYYRDTVSNITEIAKAVATLKREKKKPQT